METFQVNKEKSVLKVQLSFLIYLEFKQLFKRYIKLLYFLFGWTILYILLWTLPANDLLLSIKAVSTLITLFIWSLFLVFFIYLIVRYLKRVSWRNNALVNFSNTPIRFDLSFNSERVIYHSIDNKWDLNWNYYKYWCEEGESIYIFNERNIYEAMYISIDEIGGEMYNKFKTVVASRLSLLDK